jgi:signal transduction histidine kinase
VFAVVGLVFFEIFKTILRVESDLETLAGVACSENQQSSVEQVLKGLRDHSKDQGFMALYSAHLIKVISTFKRLSEVERKSKLMEAQANFAKQVSHDIRSPLSALNMVLTTLKDLPEEKRILMRNAVQRINDIANDLLSKGKDAAIQAAISVGPKASQSQKAGAEIILLPALVDSLMSEKRTQYRDQINVRIESDFKDSFGAFVMADGKELMRLLSNLINNSVEAFPQKIGEVVVAVRAYKEIIQLTIKDNGSGIPPEILQKLGEAGVSHGKEGTDSGSGLGIYHAKKAIEDIGGRFNIASSVGIGTMIEINFTRVSSPGWFLASLQLTPGMEILCLDDDLTIHQIWKGSIRKPTNC